MMDTLFDPRLQTEIFRIVREIDATIWQLCSVPDELGQADTRSARAAGLQRLKENVEKLRQRTNEIDALYEKLCEQEQEMR